MYIVQCIDYIGYSTRTLCADIDQIKSEDIDQIKFL